MTRIVLSRLTIGAEFHPFGHAGPHYKIVEVTPVGYYGYDTKMKPIDVQPDDLEFFSRKQTGEGFQIGDRVYHGPSDRIGVVVVSKENTQEGHYSVLWDGGNEYDIVPWNTLEFSNINKYRIQSQTEAEADELAERLGKLGLL